MKTAGRWTVMRYDTGYGLPWVCILWGGSGEHSLDGAYFRTWREALEAANRAASETRGDVGGLL
jgi:hypothetical protein